MHILDGFLNSALNTLGWIAAIATCFYAAKKFNQKAGDKRIPLMGVSAVFLLIVQLPNYPVAGTISTHFLGAVLLASLMGPWATYLTMVVVLTIQCLLGYGSLITLGANIFNLGFIGGIGGYNLLMWFKKIFPHSNRGFSHALALSTWATTIMLSLAVWIELSIAGQVKLGLLNLFGVQSLVGIIEAALTVLIVSVLIKARPDLVITHCCGGDKDACYAHHHHVDTHTHKAGQEHDHGHLY